MTLTPMLTFPFTLDGTIQAKVINEISLWCLPRHHYATARVAEEFESFFLGGWLWLPSAPAAVHVFREVRATTWAYFRLVHQRRAYHLLHWSTKNIPLFSSNRASEIKCMLNSRYSHKSAYSNNLLTSWLTLLTKRRWKNKNGIKRQKG